MSQEMHYTSVPRGLYPGSKGFCVVATTPNLSAPLRERLEGLSGYQQVFPPHDPRAGLNPVVLAHHRLSLGGLRLSLLSRVAFAGLDYTDRSNKYAHHVVIEPSERPPGGPAWLLGRPDFMDQAWRGEPRVLPTGRAVPRGDFPPRVASAWRSATGDAGWAGALAEAFLNNPERPAYLIYEPGLDPLPLFAEALALLPPARRWDVDFNTYFTVAPQGLTCAWRGALAGTPAAGQARKAPGALVLDLTRPMGSPGDGPLIHQARTGRRPAAPEPPPAPRARATIAGPSRADASAPSRPDDDLPTLKLVPTPPPTSRRRWDVDTSERPRTPAASRSRFHAARVWVSAVAILFLLLGGGSAFLYFDGGSKVDALIDQAAPKTPKNENPPPAAEQQAANDDQAPKEPAEEPKAEEPPVAKQEDPPASAPEAEKSEEPPAPEDQAPADEPGPEAEPLADPDFVHQPLFIDLPKIPEKEETGGDRRLEPVRLPLDFEVSEIALRKARGRSNVGRNADVVARPDETAPLASPKTLRIGPNDDDQRKSLTYTPYYIAQVKVEGDHLVISWDENGFLSADFPTLAEALRDCVLELKTNEEGKSHFVVLRKLDPVKKPIVLSMSGSPIKYEISSTAPWATGVKLDESGWSLEARCFQIDVTDAENKLQRLQGENPDREPRSEIEIVPGAVSLEIKPGAPPDPESETGESESREGKAVSFEIKPGAPPDLESETDESGSREGKIVITFKLHEQYTKDREDMKKYDEEVSAAQAEINAKNVKPDRLAMLQDSIDKAEAGKKKLEPRIHKYDLIENNNSSSLSLILGLRLDHETFLDLARIGTFAKGAAQP